MKQIYIVGIGPGKLEMMTGEARQALEASDAIVGYGVYVDLVKPHYPTKDYFTTPMRREIERCKLCYELANEGRTVSLICSGDAGIYGMAAPMYALLPEYQDVELIVIPGVTAASSGAALLGAPLNHDFCVISLSDLLTPWEVIERRLRAAVLGDFAIAIYNPSSHKRADYLKRACEILMDAGADPMRACGTVENIGREDTRTTVCTLKELADTQVNMFTTVFIGNSRTRIQGTALVTERGYRI